MTEYKQLINDVYEKDGTLYLKADGEYTPIQFDDHGDKGLCVLSRENIRNMGSGGYEDSNRNFCTVVSIPSELLPFDLKNNRDLDDKEVEAIANFFSNELKEADDFQREWITPNEKESIEDDFSEYLDEIGYENGMMDCTDEQIRLDYLEEVQNFQRGYIPQFHDENEILEICRNYMR